MKPEFPKGGEVKSIKEDYNSHENCFILNNKENTIYRSTVGRLLEAGHGGSFMPLGYLSEREHSKLMNRGFRLRS